MIDASMLSVPFPHSCPEAGGRPPGACNCAAWGVSEEREVVALLVEDIPTLARGPWQN